MTSQSGSDLLAKLKSSVGQEIVYQAPDEMGRPSFRQYALAIGDFNPLYSDRQFAQGHGLRDVMAPPTLICDTWQYVDSDMDEHGDLIGRGEMRDLGGLRAGNDYEFFQPIHPDDIITARWKVKDVYEKTGRSGHLAFQEIEVSFYNQREELLSKILKLFFIDCKRKQVSVLIRNREEKPWNRQPATSKTLRWVRSYLRSRRRSTWPG